MTHQKRGFTAPLLVCHYLSHNIAVRTALSAYALKVRPSFDAARRSASTVSALMDSVIVTRRPSSATTPNNARYVSVSRLYAVGEDPCDLAVIASDNDVAAIEGDGLDFFFIV